MKKQLLYEYLGTNGTILSPIYLEGIYCVKKWSLIAEPGYVLTKDNKHFVDTVIVPDNELNEWSEVLGQK